MSNTPELPPEPKTDPVWPADQGPDRDRSKGAVQTLDPRSSAGRRFLFLQGPHGPFFYQLSTMLRRAGAQTWRVGFNAGDRVFWPDRASYIAYRQTPDRWADHIAEVIAERQITDLVLYGDTRAIHADAVRAAKAAHLRVHVFEEGYLRPYWATYERDGSNGHSRLMDMDVADMVASLADSDREAAPPPSHWGDTRQHIFYGALYHGCVMLLNRGYPAFRPHRGISVTREFQLYLRRLVLMPLQALERRWATRRVRNGGFPYHLLLLQLEHDSAFQAHSPFSTNADFMEEVCRGFAKGAPQHHHLVVKAHPLEDGRSPVRQQLRDLACRYGIADRLHYVRGGKLARLLDDAVSAVTVNSTAGQQALWRGIPLKIFGKAVYGKPQFVSDQALTAFFANPKAPDLGAYRDYRRYLLETSQLPGGFYSRKGRKQLLRQVVDRMLAVEDPYAAHPHTAQPGTTAAAPQQLQVVN
ncbi:capsule biosynthesis protein CapA [Phaeobacter sp.]|uniref:capsule biosynthesis protein n=1 Tax=Phaeobacter sp. TaxID=1902409 RepID=UPI0025E0997E|nr:capsule biosynthesis protein CapA [Phaeobacter sp.]